MSADFQQLDLENQRGSTGDGGRVAGVPIGDRRGTYEPGLAADFHFLYAFGPTRDDAVQRELRGLVALVGTIEFRSIDERAAIVHLYGVRGGRRGSGAGTEVGVDQT